MTKTAPHRGAVGQAVRLGKALASPVRIRALEALRARELCLCELAELFGTAASTMSRHMSLLVAAGLVRSRRDGRWTYYTLPQEETGSATEALAVVHQLAAGDPQVSEDRSRIRILECR